VNRTPMATKKRREPERARSRHGETVENLLGIVWWEVFATLKGRLIVRPALTDELIYVRVCTMEPAWFHKRPMIRMG
jgi:hypothetical protein